MNETIEVWGDASGVGSTRGVRRGALAWRQYPNHEAADEAIRRGDWLTVLLIAPVEDDLTWEVAL